MQRRVADARFLDQKKGDRSAAIAFSCLSFVEGSVAIL